MQNVKYSSEAKIFIEEENINKYVEIYISLVTKTFSKLKTIRIEKSTDIESMEEKIVLKPELLDDSLAEENYSKYINLLDLSIENGTIPIEISYLFRLE